MKNNGKTLILTYGNLDTLSHVYDIGIDLFNVEFKRIYKNWPSFLLKICRNSFFVYFCMDKWKTNINLYDKIILTDNVATISVVKWFKRNYKNKDGKIIYYYFNTIKSIKNTKSPDILKKYDLELWSYNIHDCKKYNINYNKQVGIKKLYSINDNNQCKYDIVFLGYTKGRKELLMKINDFCINNNINAFFYIPDCDDFPNNRCKNGKPISYEKYIEIAKNSKSILDIVTSKNYGLTLRPLEALFLNKKLITNYADIKDYDLYNENIFILDNNINNLKKFLKESDIICWDSEIVNSYDISEWIKRFDN